MPFDPRVHVGVGLILVNPLAGLLMIERQGAHGAGQWSVVGGWIDHGETPGQAVIREAQEEVGITVVRPVYAGSSTFVYDDEPHHRLTLFQKVHYSYDTMAPKIQEPDKISKLAWVGYDHIDMLDLFGPFEQHIENGFKW